MTIFTTGEQAVLRGCLNDTAGRAGPVFELVSPALLQPAVPLFGAIALTIILSGGADRLRLEDVAAAGPRALLLGVGGFVFSVAAVCLRLWLVTTIGFLTPALRSSRG